MERIPQSGELYRHFKNKMYQVIAVATHSETGEKLVIYQALYGDYQVYARPLAMFISEVDRTKYPETAQNYRFERVERTSLQREAQTNEMKTSDIKTCKEQQMDTNPINTSYPEESGVNPKLLAFLDADDLEEKYEILLTMRNEVNDQLINNMAVTLDVVIPDGDIQMRYEQLKNCLKTKQRYEIEWKR